MAHIAGEAKGPFIFTPFAARREAAVPAGPVQWVAGETATVEVDISNPTTIPIKVSLLLLPPSTSQGQDADVYMRQKIDRRLLKPLQKYQ